MFGFFSYTPFSTSGSLFFSGQEHPLILYVKQNQAVLSQTKTNLCFTMTIQQNPLVIL